MRRLALVAAALLGTGSLRAQGLAPCEPPLATLAAWADDVWLALSDRDGSYHGRLSDAGTFQRFNPLMDAEYELDLATGLFGPGEDAGWAAAPQGLRVAGASINHPFILNFADWKEEVPVQGRVRLQARYRRQKSLTAQRDYPQVGVSWGEPGAGRWGAGVAIGMHFFKSSADVELALARGSQACGARGPAIEVRLAMLDAFNNVIFNALGVRPEETPAHFDYRRLPFAGRASFAWRWGRGRVELQAGSTSRSAVRISFPAAGDPPYTRYERVGFAGALLELAPTRRAALILLGTVAHAETERRFTPADSADFEVRERTRAIGLRWRFFAAETRAVELDLRGTWRPEDRRRGDGSSVRHRDRELLWQLAMRRAPPTGWTWRLAYAGLDRDAGPLAPRLTTQEHRLVMDGGHRFRSRFEVTAGLRWDLDRFVDGIFDGGHLRLAATWE